jgi:hypothetical protein
MAFFESDRSPEMINIANRRVEAITKSKVEFVLERKKVIKFSGRKRGFCVLKDFGVNLMKLYPINKVIMIWVNESGRLIFDLKILFGASEEIYVNITKTPPSITIKII